MNDFQTAFLQFALQHRALRFGEFTTKAGRNSPYFFNAGLFYDGASLAQLGQFYAQTLLKSDIKFDMLFGPAYKGITLAAATAIALSVQGRAVPFAYNRKETKDHGEGGSLVGAPLQGRVVIIDDVISAGTSVRESICLIRQAGAEPVAVLIALDRQERGEGALSATQEIWRDYQIPVIAIANLQDLLQLVASNSEYSAHQPAITAYRKQYGAQS